MMQASAFRGMKKGGKHIPALLRIVPALLLIFELRGEELAVQARDVRDRNRLGALGLAGARVGAVAEAQLVHLGDHRLGAACTLHTALRQFGERRYAGGDEELLETEIPLDDRIPDAAHEDGENDRPVYDEEGYRHDPGGE